METTTTPIHRLCARWLTDEPGRLVLTWTPNCDDHARVMAAADVELAA